MSITLLSAVPGGGKTSYAVWHEIKPAVEAGRIVYTCGIPKLTLPTIQTTYDKLSRWHERTKKEEISFEETDEIYELNNYAEGSLIIIDEAWKLWPAAGRGAVSEDIEYLRMHRHHGIDFLLIARAPNLVHPQVLCLVEKHLHITPTWSGRKIFEWTEYCSTPRLKTSKLDAVKRPYKLPKESFALYESASIHTKPSKTIPAKLWASLAVLIVAPLMFYLSVVRVLDKMEQTEPQEETQLAEKPKEENEQPKPTPINHPNNHESPIAPVRVAHTVVSDQIDWNKVSSCLSNKTSCVCYGKSAERLVIPPETCRIAVKHGWPGENVVITATNL